MKRRLAALVLATAALGGTAALTIPATAAPVAAVTHTHFFA